MSSPSSNSSSLCEFSINGRPRKSISPELEPAKHKTEMCKHYEMQKTCPFGSRCAFAHEPHELLTRDRPQKYKTVKCVQFHTSGFCVYGRRCHFIH
uniref:C3H1-type domain-containing protein n=1 Tax=Macrostomum lignano TaxID=282301 RepID=A0A1I8IHN5_9PLAT